MPTRCHAPASPAAHACSRSPASTPAWQPACMCLASVCWKVSEEPHYPPCPTTLLGQRLGNHGQASEPNTVLLCFDAPCLRPSLSTGIRPCSLHAVCACTCQNDIMRTQSGRHSTHPHLHTAYARTATPTAHCTCTRTHDSKMCQPINE